MTVRRIIVKSKTTLRDFQTFAPTLSGKVRVVPFVPHVPNDIYQRDPRKAILHYHLPERFFFLPNQFLKHKNHAVVLTAISILKRRGLNVSVVCTGTHQDGRTSNCFGELLARRAEQGLDQQFIVLDHVPRLSFFELMRQSLCVLNPTLFEGFGLSMAEARWVGKRVLVSDLPVLREHGHPNATYFDPHNADELADKLALIWNQERGGPDIKAEADSRQTYSHAQLNFAQHFMRVAEEAVAGGHRDDVHREIPTSIVTD